jgi:predicted dehydrogenase
MIGVGGMARYHVASIVGEQGNGDIVVVCEPSPTNYEKFVEKCKEHKVKAPPNVPDLAKLLKDYAGKLDAAFIITPHALHHDQTKMCLEAGLDVLLEKPMVMNGDEARSLINIRDRTGRLLVIAFQGGLSPQIRHTVKLLRSGELGELLNISGTVWQGWNNGTQGTWRQQPELAGGGFLFDTGAHMLNTICDLVGEDFTQVVAWLDNRQRPVDIRGVVMGKLANGVMVTINGCGDTFQTIGSEIFVICTKGVVHTGMWGEYLEIQRPGENGLSKAGLSPMGGAWEQFVQVRCGEIPNPCPPEVGLRMARLWDAIQASAKQNGAVIKLQ